MNVPMTAFTTPLAPLARPHHGTLTVQVSSRRPLSFVQIRNSASNVPSTSSASLSKRENTGIWNGICRFIRVSAVSASLIVAPALTSGGIFRVASRPVMMTSNNDNTSVRTASSLISRQRVSSPHAAIAATTKSSRSESGSGPSTTSDVEAAAMTLGAVTLGGLLMRAVISRSRDEESERAKLAAECARLEEEERARALRAERAKLEAVDSPSDDLMSEFRKRIESMDKDKDNLDSSYSSSTDSGSDSDDDKKDHMRHSPIPDRGTGSAVLDRPDNTSSSDSSEDDDENANDENNNQPMASNSKTGDGSDSDGDNFAKPDQLEMLKRMWNLSSPDKE